MRAISMAAIAAVALGLAGCMSDNNDSGANGGMAGGSMAGESQVPGSNPEGGQTTAGADEQ